MISRFDGTMRILKVLDPLLEFSEKMEIVTLLLQLSLFHNEGEGAYICGMMNVYHNIRRN